MKNIIILIVFGVVAGAWSSWATISSLKNTGAIPTKYETGEIIKHRGRVFMLIEMQTEYRPLIPEEVER